MSSENFVYIYSNSIRGLDQFHRLTSKKFIKNGCCVYGCCTSPMLPYKVCTRHFGVPFVINLCQKHSKYKYLLLRYGKDYIKSIKALSNSDILKIIKFNESLKTEKSQNVAKKNLTKAIDRLIKLGCSEDEIINQCKLIYNEHIIGEIIK